MLPNRVRGLLRASITAVRSRPWVVLRNSHFLDTVMQDIVVAATRDVETHRQGRLFARFISDGPEHEDTSHTSGERKNGLLTDDEAEEAVEFVRSHMVNRFKGDLAELLALPPACMSPDCGSVHRVSMGLPASGPAMTG